MAQTKTSNPNAEFRLPTLNLICQLFIHLIASEMHILYYLSVQKNGAANFDRKLCRYLKLVIRLRVLN